MLTNHSSRGQRILVSDCGAQALCVGTVLQSAKDGRGKNGEVKECRKDRTKENEERKGAFCKDY